MQQRASSRSQMQAAQEPSTGLFFKSGEQEHSWKHHKLSFRFLYSLPAPPTRSVYNWFLLETGFPHLQKITSLPHRLCCSSNSAQYQNLTQALTYTTPGSSGVIGGCCCLWSVCKENHPSKRQRHRSFEMASVAPVHHPHPPQRGKAERKELPWERNSGKRLWFLPPKAPPVRGTFGSKPSTTTYTRQFEKREVCK